MPVTFFDPPVDITPGTATSWVDVDYAGVPDGASGVIVHIINTTTSGALDVGLRVNGSTDTILDTLFREGHRIATVGVDANGIFEAYIEDTTDIVMYIVGYFDGAFSFFTNVSDVSLSTENAWVDIDISSLTGGDTAIGAFLKTTSTGNSQEWGMRKNGSTDTLFQRSIRHGWAFIGVDGSEILEGNRSVAGISFYLIGYATDSVVFNTNGIDRELSGTDAYEDLPALPVGAIGGIYELAATGNLSFMTMRKNGATYDYYYRPSRHVFFLLECDASRLVEAKSDDLLGGSDNYYELGYFEGASAITVTMNQAFESNTTLNITENPISRLISQSLEEDISLSLSESPISRLISQVNESNVSNNINVTMILLLNEVNENNISLLITLNPISRLINSVNESDVPLNISENPLIRLINLVNESNESLNVNKIASKLISQVNENDISLNIIENPITRLINNVNENDISLSYGKISSKLINNVNENNIASSIILPTQIINVNNVNENNGALNITENPISKLISQIFESDEVFSISLIDETYSPYLLFKKRRRML